MIIWQVVTEGWLRLGNRAGKTQPCMQMGENELEWVSVTSGNMNVLNSAFIFFWCGLNKFMV